ncbi:MAG: Stp1/IreP family PP2C-type Ser/Thr phosphatase [Lachnospiraceae bacterium]|nr:Stp1/IreP family PP2C-type Ser/Thr phosphatase [Lachnospiraceae bacterium]
MTGTRSQKAEDLSVYKVAHISDVGLQRNMNQDVVFASDVPIGNLPNLFIVADGMGGHKAGDYASRYTVDTIVEEVKNSPEQNPTIILRKAIEKANTGVVKLSAENPALEGMGTTVVAATCIGKYMRVANVGDSRLYVVNRKIRQITRDHSYVEEMVERGSLDRASARTHPQKNIITRAVGGLDTIDVDFFEVELEPGDLVLLCSDGLTNMIDDEKIRILMNTGRDVVEKAEELVRAANENGGKDNISVIIVEPFADEVEDD